MLSHAVITTVYIAPSSNAAAACELLHTVVSQLQTWRPQSLLLISGDFNPAPLSSTLTFFTVCETKGGGRVCFLQVCIQWIDYCMQTWRKHTCPPHLVAQITAWSICYLITYLWWRKLCLRKRQRRFGARRPKAERLLWYHRLRSTLQPIWCGHQQPDRLHDRRHTFLCAECCVF